MGNHLSQQRLDTWIFPEFNQPTLFDIDRKVTEVMKYSGVSYFFWEWRRLDSVCTICYSPAPMGAGHCPWGGFTDWNVCNIHGEARRYRAMLRPIVKEPISKKCVIKGDNLCVTGPTKNLHILNAEWVLITVWGAVYLYLWEFYGLP